ncbi:MAG: Phosphopentomutase DeoB [Thermoanaerobacterales bacterium 50_218]|nr:MAG: Phosphopentomutase DeoB [Thermoanaerobacterales bacterium 50_218]HAA90439.1 phosphopentomutase [Peptococcaceae bacterium]
MKRHTREHKKFAGKKKALLLVLDGVGVGELPDAVAYGDQGSCTLGNLARAVGGLDLPNLRLLGLGNIIPISGVTPVEQPRAAYGKMKMQAAGKDSTSGHWELTGVILKKPFPVYPNGFPPEVITAFESRIGRKVLGNKPASGTVIIEELGRQHLETGCPIVYTSADSVFQVAAHEEIIPVPQLYRMCEIARQILTGKHAVGRVIARPFIGKPGSFQRTPRRRDFSLPPPRPTLLDHLQEAGYEVVSVGKVADIFAGQGITTKIPASGNKEICLKALDAFEELEEGLVVATLVDFDTLYGHRNDCRGFARALAEFDQFLPKILEKLAPGSLLVITADHGCDPTTPSTDHSREYVPLLISGPDIEPLPVGTRQTMADLGATLAHFFGVETGEGTPILEIFKSDLF